MKLKLFITALALVSSTTLFAVSGSDDCTNKCGNWVVACNNIEYCNQNCASTLVAFSGVQTFSSNCCTKCFVVPPPGPTCSNADFCIGNCNLSPQLKDNCIGGS